MEAREPHDRRLLNFGPLIVLLYPVGKVSHPAAELLLGLGSKFGPPCGQVAVL